MDFEFDAHQEALRNAVRRWADKDFTFARRLALAHSGGAARDVWSDLAGLGVVGLAVPEAHGGLGLGAVEAMVVCEELGRALVHAPYTAAALVVPALLRAGPAALQAAWLPRIARSALVVLAHQESGARYRLAPARTTASRGDDGGWTVTGAKSVVPAGDEADAYLVPATLPAPAGPANGGARSVSLVPAGSLGLFLVERGAVRVLAHPTHDGARVAEVAFDAAPALPVLATAGVEEDGDDDGSDVDGDDAGRAGAGHALALLETAVDIASAAQCAEAVGLMDRLLAVTVEHMATRRQFGVPIASFQAPRHRIADVKMQLELGRSMSYYATLKLGEAPAQRRRAVSQARVQLGRSMRFVGQQCIQLHGAIGLTDEHIASHLFKRLTMLEMSFGDTLHHLGEVSARMQDTAGAFD